MTDRMRAEVPDAGAANRARDMRQRVALLALLFSLAWTGPGVAAGTAAAVPWTQIEYAARKFALSTEAQIALSRLPRDQALTQLLAPGEGIGLQPQDPAILLMSVTNSFLGQDSRIQFWFNPDGSTLQRTTVYSGRRLWYRTYRYTETGVYSLKRRPRSGEEKLAAERWTDTAKNFYPYNQVAAAPMITSSEALFYLLSVSNLAKPGDELLLHAFTKTGVAVVRLRGEAFTTVAAEFAEQTAGRTIHVDGDVDVLRIALTARPLQRDQPVEDLNLLGLRGNAELYFDATRRIILQLSGEADVVGDLDIKLRRVVR